MLDHFTCFDISAVCVQPACSYSGLPIRVACGWRRFARNAALSYAAPSRIGGWNDSAVSQGKKIQVSCDTSVMKVSTSGRPCGLA